MTLHKNEKGIALITALLFTLLSLGIVMMLLYIITQGTKITGAQKRYSTALEASYGASELLSKDILPSIFRTYTTATSIATVPALFAGVSLTIPDSSCLLEKTQNPTSLWDSAVCSPPTKTNLPNVSADMTFNLKALNDPTGYRVYAKIIDTRCGGDVTIAGQTCSNSDSSGIDYLDGAEGVTGGGGIVGTPHKPAYYKIEIQGERASNPKEKSKLSLLYEY